MKTEIFPPRQALNKAFLRVKPNLCQVEKFPTHPQTTLGERGDVFLHTKTMIGEFNISENGRDNPKKLLLNHVKSRRND
jgi:hypothetical protein